MKRKATGSIPPVPFNTPTDPQGSRSLTAQASPQSSSSSRHSLSKELKSLTLAHPKKSDALQPPKKMRKPVTVDFDDDVVGVLRGDVNGRDVMLLIKNTGEHAEIGSNASCDIRLWDKSFKKRYRAYSVKTDDKLAFTCLHDVSRSGFTIRTATHEIHYDGKRPTQLGQRTIHQHAIVLFDKDVVRFADDKLEQKRRPSSFADIALDEFTYRHNFALYGPTAFPRPDEDEMNRPRPLFSPEEDHLTKYRIDSWLIDNWPLGAGMFAYVNLANHEAGGFQVACKTVRIEPQDEQHEDDDTDSLTSWTGRSIRQAGTEAYADEVKILREICHPNIAGFLDVVPEVGDQRIHLIMELVTGGDLFAYIEKHFSLTESEVSFFGYQLCKALDHIHRNDIAHRDIKPDNILLAVSDAYPRLILSDFGQTTTFDKILELVPEDRDEPCVRKYNQVGTLDYLPPERLKAIIRHPQGKRGMMEEKAVNWQLKRLEIAGRWFEEETMIDSWGLGCVLYFCFSGIHPYWSEDGSENDMNVCMELAGGSEWKEFRKERGSGTAAPRTSLDPEMILKIDRIETRISRFTSSKMWRPEDKWSQASPELCNFISSLLQHHPSQRLKLQGSDYNDYFIDRKPELEDMYNTVVVRGRLWPRRGH